MVTVYTLIVGYGILAFALAAWWQLRRSAHLLPYLRRGPSSFLFDPGYVFVSWIMAIGTWRALLAIRLWRWLVERVAGAPDGRHARAASVSGAAVSEADAEESTSATLPIPVPTGLVAMPLPRLGSTSQPPSELEIDPPTCPLPVGARSPGHPALLIGPPAGPTGGESGY